MGRIKFPGALIIAILSFFAYQPANAQNFSYSINIHGIPFNCTANNGQPVPIFTDPQSAAAAAPLGGARADAVPGLGYRISLNLAMLSQTPPRSAVMVFFHECAHVALPMNVGLNSPMQEVNADCWAVQQMVAHGFVTSWQEFNEAVTYVYQIGGMNGITQQRINQMAQCL